MKYQLVWWSHSRGRSRQGQRSTLAQQQDRRELPEPYKTTCSRAAGVHVSDQAVRTWPRGEQGRARLEEPDRTCRDKDAENGGKIHLKEEVILVQSCKGVFFVQVVFCFCSDLSFSFDIEKGRISSPAAFNHLLQGDFPNLN